MCPWQKANKIVADRANLSETVLSMHYDLYTKEEMNIS